MTLRTILAALGLVRDGTNTSANTQTSKAAINREWLAHVAQLSPAEVLDQIGTPDRGHRLARGNCREAPDLL